MNKYLYRSLIGFLAGAGSSLALAAILESSNMANILGLLTGAACALGLACCCPSCWDRELARD